MSLALSQFVMLASKLRVISYLILYQQVFPLLHCSLFLQMYGDQLPHQLVDSLIMLVSLMTIASLLGFIC